MRVLVIEDDPAMAGAIELVLTSVNFAVQKANLGELGLSFARIEHFDLITLDLGLPDMSGFEVINRLRASKVDTPLIVLTGDYDVEAKVQALSAGADDFITKPFHADELIARALAVLRRAAGHADSLITTGRVTLNLSRRVALVDEAELHLTAKEYLTLELLFLRKGVPLSRDAFIAHLYRGEPRPPDERIVDVFICKLRKKLAAATAGQQYIDSIREGGYRLRNPEHVQIAA